MLGVTAGNGYYAGCWGGGLSCDWVQEGVLVGGQRGSEGRG